MTILRYVRLVYTHRGKPRCRILHATAVWRLTLAACLNVSAFAAPKPEDAQVFFFTNETQMTSAGMKTRCTNGFNLSFSRHDLDVLPQSFLTNLVEDIGSSKFPATITDNQFSNASPGLAPLLLIRVKIDEFSVSLGIGANYPPDLANAYKLFEKRAMFYLSTRFEGHSHEYAMAAITESFNTNSAALLLPEDPRGVPAEWIKQKQKVGHFYLIVDGPFAWLYGSAGQVVRCDAKEYDPALADKFAAARNEASLQLKKKGGPRAKSSYELHAEMQRILKSKYNINWMTPEELKLYF